MKNQLILSILGILLFAGATAQKLVEPVLGFSKKKTSYITLTDGTEINGTIGDIDRNKGLIEYIKIEDGAGKKHKLEADKVKYMYLPPSGLDKMTKVTDAMFDMQKWNDETLNKDLLNQGYAYFELADVKVKKSEEKLLMQLLNPGFSKMVKIYHDPAAGETKSLGIGPVDMIGGDAKAYYIAKGDEPAYKLEKKNYDEEFVPLWKSCQKIIEEYKDMKWANFVDHVIAYSECQE